MATVRDKRSAVKHVICESENPVHVISPFCSGKQPCRLGIEDFQETEH